MWRLTKLFRRPPSQASRSGYSSASNIAQNAAKLSENESNIILGNKSEDDKRKWAARTPSPQGPAQTSANVIGLVAKPVPTSKVRVAAQIWGNMLNGKKQARAELSETTQTELDTEGGLRTSKQIASTTTTTKNPTTTIGEPEKTTTKLTIKQQIARQAGAELGQDQLKLGLDFNQI